MAPEGPEQIDFPHNWDRLEDRTISDDQPLADSDGPVSDGQVPLRLSLFAAVWADMVAITAVCTLALLALVSLGYRATVPAFPWAAAVGLVWWCAAAAANLVVRRGTPGMLMAGVVYGDRLRPARVPAALLAALLLCLSLGLLALLGARLSPLRLAAGVELSTVEAERVAMAG